MPRRQNRNVLAKAIGTGRNRVFDRIAGTDSGGGGAAVPTAGGSFRRKANGYDIEGVANVIMAGGRIVPKWTLVVTG